MEFDRKRTRWTHIVAYLIYTAIMVSLLLNSNPYLYSHKELRQALVGEQVNSINPVRGAKRADPKGAPEDDTRATYWWRSTPERTGHDQNGGTRDKDFVTDWQKPILENVSSKSVPEWAVDESGLYIVSKEPWIMALGTDGELKWRFRFAAQDGEIKNYVPVLDEQAVYVSHAKGSVAAMEKSNGHLLWKVKLASEILAAPIMVNGELWLLVNPLESERKRLEAKEDKGTAGKNKSAPAIPPHRLIRLNAISGEVVDYSQPFNVTGQANLTWAREFKQVLVATDNKLHMINSDDGQIIATQTLPDPIEGPAVVAEGKAFLALSSGKVQAWDISKKGKFEWEIDLVSPPRAAPTYIPVYQQLAIPTADGALHTIDLKKSEAGWRLNADNHNPQNDLWAARLSGRFIEKLSMKWEKKGWTIWAPCSDNRICVYNPEKGQLLARIPAPGAVASSPVFLGKELYLIARDGKDSYTFKLVHYLDEDSFKKKAKDAQKTAETSL